MTKKTKRTSNVLHFGSFAKNAFFHSESRAVAPYLMLQSINGKRNGSSQQFVCFSYSGPGFAGGSAVGWQRGGWFLLERQSWFCFVPPFPPLFLSLSLRDLVRKEEEGA